MELRNINAFLRVAELESFTRAAQELGYSQSTVTVQIHQLEEELGCPLFDRIGKQIALTPKGREFLTYAGQMAAIEEQMKSLGGSGSRPKGPLRLGILESLFAWVFLPQLPQYHADYPGVTLRTKTAAGEELFQRLRRNELDIIFILGQKTLEPDLIRALEHEEDIVFVTAAGEGRERRRETSLQEVAKLPMILTERSSVYRRLLEQVAAERNVALSPFLEVDSTAVLVRLVTAGLGVSFLPRYTVREGMERGELTELVVPGCPTRLWSQIFYHKSKWVTPQMEGFIQAIRSAYGQE